jgi:hypothetical protein
VDPEGPKTCGSGSATLPKAITFGGLKGLSHEIRLQKFGQKITALGVSEGLGWFLNF